MTQLQEALEKANKQYSETLWGHLNSSPDAMLLSDATLDALKAAIRMFAENMPANMTLNSLVKALSPAPDCAMFHNWQLSESAREELKQLDNAVMHGAINARNIIVGNNKDDM